jgi:uncharacterized protein YbbK (DUF523 family)
MTRTIAVGVSACLLGEKVRYDGGHRHDSNITGILGEFFVFVPVCPEVECGMSIPREPMHLEGDPAKPRLMTVESGIDKTKEMTSFCRAKVGELANEALCGFIFKANSPSCGLFGVSVHNTGIPAGTGRGLFAAALVERFPILPVEEERGLNNPTAREKFIERVFNYNSKENDLCLI